MLLIDTHPGPQVTTAMDPLTALSAAGNILQFVTFAIKILSTGHQLYHSSSGTLSAHDELKLVAQDIADHATRLSQSVQPLNSALSHSDLVITHLCRKSHEAAEDLLLRLNGLKIEGKNGVAQSFRYAFKTTWAKSDLNASVERLEGLRKSIETWLLMDIRSEWSWLSGELGADAHNRTRVGGLSLQQSERFELLDTNSQRIITALLDLRTSVPRDLSDQMKAVALMLTRMEQSQNKTNGACSKFMPEGTDSSLGYIQDQTSEHLKLSLWQGEKRVKKAVENDILEALRFSTMLDRREEVPKAHQTTFRWVFQCSDFSQPQTSFVSWLRSGNGIFWINGKAGSGKSTLMRFIYDNSQTRQVLTEWANGTTLSLSVFFFWNSGTLEQRSQCGLLRSLLFEVLREYTDLIPVVLPWLWARRYSATLDPSGVSEHNQLSLAQVKEAFATLVHQKKVPLKLCLFIDGLDEYEGDHEKIAEFFMTLSQSLSVKICVSSRPLLVFEDAFAGCPNLKLQDLTLVDIENYVHSQLTTHSRYQRHAFEEPMRAPLLEHEIVTRADGVFLWVRLVVDSLLSGLGNRDDIIDLEKRLRTLPGDLEKLYQHMLMRRIDPLYIDRASMMFQIVQVGSLDTPLSILNFAFTDPSHTDRSINEIIRPWTANEISIAC